MFYFHALMPNCVSCLLAHFGDLQSIQVDLSVNVNASSVHNPGLQNQVEYLQATYRDQGPCVIPERLLNFVIFTALLAGLIAIWSGWLLAEGRWFCGATVAVFGMCLYLLFCDNGSKFRPGQTRSISIRCTPCGIEGSTR